MPIGFDPNDTCLVMLNCVDKEKPDDRRAKFKVKFLSSRQVKQMAKLRDEALNAIEPEEQDAKLNEALLIGLVGWEGLAGDDGKPLPFSPESLDEFSHRLKSWMISEIPSRIFFAEADLKNSASRLTPTA